MLIVSGSIASRLDSYANFGAGDIAIEAFTCLIIFKVSHFHRIFKVPQLILRQNFFSFGLTWSAYDWLVASGTYKCFMWISSIQVLVCLLSVPMCMFQSLFQTQELITDCPKMCWGKEIGVSSTDMIFSSYLA
jgi:hypothetical protein